ncbi:MAG: cyclic lactone autoinducer peptide [Clostridiaceae bacterium]|nr:cyclic lactone autoinducer peptide [Clostridiaceae bacterium]
MLRAKIFKALGALITLIALVSASAASIWLLYQPRQPKCLDK